MIPLVVVYGENQVQRCRSWKKRNAVSVLWGPTERASLLVRSALDRKVLLSSESDLGSSELRLKGLRMSNSERDDLLRQIDAAIARIDNGRPVPPATAGHGEGEKQTANDPVAEEKQALSRWRWGFRSLGDTAT